MKNQSYNLATISPDLRREETVKQISDALEYLEKVSNDIFSKISVRVSDIRKKLETIDDRVSVAQAKVDRLKGSNKATKVFSSYKYPGADNVDAFLATFLVSKTNNLDLEEIKRSSTKLTTKHLTYNESQLQNKVKFFNVRIPEKNEKIEGEGLGRLPSNIISISNMLLFNTSENPYKKYVMLDPLGAVTKTRKALEDEDDETIGAAPLSISQREQLEKQNVETYSYIPDMGDVPEMDVPFALPDLPGVADDLSFGADLGPSIAPSIPGNNAIPDLPSFSSEVPGAPASSSEPYPPPTEGPAPPPPPPAAPAPPPATGGAPPPPPPPPPPSHPPPPPPPPPSVPSSEPPSSVVADVPKEVASPGDARSDLLASIRKAGGSGKAKLKSVKDKKIEAKKKKQEEKTIEKSGAGGGDLMSDLFNKLTMRRKGISGTGKTSNENEAKPAPAQSNVGNPDSAMAKISSMIPPPPKPTSEVDGVDGDDNEDWSD